MLWRLTSAKFTEFSLHCKIVCTFSQHIVLCLALMSEQWLIHRHRHESISVECTSTCQVVSLELIRLIELHCKCHCNDYCSRTCICMIVASVWKLENALPSYRAGTDPMYLQIRLSRCNNHYNNSYRLQRLQIIIAYERAINHSREREAVVLDSQGNRTFQLSPVPIQAQPSKCQGNA